MVEKELVLRRADQVTFEVVAGEAILIDMNSGTYFSLNEVGTMFWEELDGERSLMEIAELIAATYNEKSGRFVRRLKRAVVENETLDVVAVAEAYGVEPDEVGGYLQRLQRDELEETATVLMAEFLVAPAVVVADLLELTQKMMADQLLLAK